MTLLELSPDTIAPDVLKSCCAAVYESEWARPQGSATPLVVLQHLERDALGLGRLQRLEDRGRGRVGRCRVGLHSRDEVWVPGDFHPPEGLDVLRPELLDSLARPLHHVYDA